MRVGTVVQTGVDWPAMNVLNGMIGVVYAVINETVMIIFENGEYCGFAPVEMKTVNIIGFNAPISLYKFSNVMNLCNDYRRGLFDSVLKHKLYQPTKGDQT